MNNIKGVKVGDETILIDSYYGALETDLVSLITVKKEEASPSVIVTGYTKDREVLFKIYSTEVTVYYK